ncbi:hypothetical protein BS78_06G188800 [Paspalum vaginatum]|nr:hypothetical protein BS78_06G188800 [Paspalum vaginatum]KAJ1272263.1 hypothetical protein BS78_06G188800 [Paspalum vaginatum]
MRVNPILTALSSAAFGFFIGVSFPVQIAPQLPCYLFSWSGGVGVDVNSTFNGGTNNILGRLWVPFVSSSNNSRGAGGEEGTTATAAPPPGLQQPAAKNNGTASASASPSPEARGPEARLPPNIVVSESDLHLRRLWGNPREDTPVRKYLLTMTVGYSEKANVNATVHKFSDSSFDVMLFHYDGRTTEWDEEFPWSKQAVHVGARKQAKWWYAKRFLHPSVVAPYEYLFLWDEDLDAAFFDADEYVRLVRKHGLRISQPGLDATRGKTSYEVVVRRNGSEEVHRNTSGPGFPGSCPDLHQRPCSGFVEVMAPVFSRDAWACVWHMIQNDLVHGWGLDINFWRCVDDPERQIGVVDAQYVAHRAVPTLGQQGNPETGGGGGGKVRDREWREFGDFKARIRNAERAQQQEAAAALRASASPS